MTAVVCDASPLVFLAKTDRLDLLKTIPGGNIVILECVVREVLSDRASPWEKTRLSRFFQNVRRVDYEKADPAVRALSRSDQSILNWAIENRAEWLVADERLLRRAAREHGMATIGFCGILMRAVQEGLIKKREARTNLDEAITHHGFRISLSLYKNLLERLS